MVVMKVKQDTRRKCLEPQGLMTVKGRLTVITSTFFKEEESTFENNLRIPWNIWLTGNKQGSRLPY